MSVSHTHTFISYQIESTEYEVRSSSVSSCARRTERIVGHDTEATEVSRMRPTEYPRDRNRLRTYIYERDGYRCQHCGQQGGPSEAVELHVRRIVPASRGGTGHPRNLVTLCRTCRDRISDHHVVGSGDRFSPWTTEDPSESSPRTGGQAALLFLGGVVLPFSLTLLVMASNAGFP